MTLFKHELKTSRTPFWIWTVTISFLLSLCVFLFPEMKDKMSSFNDMFSSMGSLSQAFGMDRLNMGTLVGFYALECGNILGLGGAFYASLTAVGMLSKEEKDKTAEFLLSHPISRTRVLTEKLCALFVLITSLNLIVFGVTVGTIVIIGEPIPWKEVGLLHVSFYFLQLELAGVCFGISSFLRKSGAGLGLGIALLMYVLHLIANISEKVDFLKYITPFSYCDGAEIVTSLSLDTTKLFIGLSFGLLGILVSYLHYVKKDIQ
ncbi:ABC transporter permease subunit [Guggenheimella bovis]